RGADGRADGDRGEGDPRRLRGRDARDRAGGRGRHGGRQGRSAHTACAAARRGEGGQAARRQVRVRRAAGAGRGVISETANAASRKAILALADSSRLDHVVRRHGMRLGAGRFVAGETLDQLVPVLRRLDDQGLLTNTTLLGEGIRSPEEAGVVVVAYREILDRVSAEGLRTNVALKLTH